MADATTTSAPAPHTDAAGEEIVVAVRRKSAVDVDARRKSVTEGDKPKRKSVVDINKVIVQAYENADAEASRLAHEVKKEMPFESAPENHGGQGSGFIKSVVFGGLDGIITTFSIIAAVAGASLAMEVVLLMGFANLIADAISMGLGDFLSEKAELTFLRAEYAREMWEFENFPEGEISEMVSLYKEKGVGEEDAKLILKTMAKYPTLFVEHMFNVEIGEMRPSDDENPAMNGFVTFCSFVLFGSVPVVAYAIQWGAKYTDKQGAFGVTCAVTALTMFALGATQARITRQPVVNAGLTMMCNGSLAAAAAYLVGWGLEQAIGRGEC